MTVQQSHSEVFATASPLAPSSGIPLAKRTAAVAEAAATEADAVDREARFPQRAIDAARRERLLGV